MSWAEDNGYDIYDGDYDDPDNDPELKVLMNSMDFRRMMNFIRYLLTDGHITSDEFPAKILTFYN